MLRRHGDEIARLHKGYFRAQGRADDAMNLGGIKVSSVELERVIESHRAVQEAAAVGVQIEAEGPEKLVVFVVLQPHADGQRLRPELQARIATELNPLFRIAELIAVDALPRTASNKVLRRQPSFSVRWVGKGLTGSPLLHMGVPIVTGRDERLFRRTGTHPANQVQVAPCLVVRPRRS